MSGIAAVLGSRDPDTLQILTDKLRFRGIYISKVVEGENFAMVELGTGPPDSRDHRPVVIDGYFAGFHSDEINSLLTGSGEGFEDLFSGTDSVLYSHFEGEFALAVNVKGDDFLIARDPLGVKPLYCVINGDTCVAASEIKALTGLGPINEVPPGSYFRKGCGWKRYYRIPQIYENESISLAEAEEELRFRLLQSVKEKIDGVSRLGVYLGGGPESSVIAFAASELSPEPIATFSVGVKGSSDLEYARKVAAGIGSRHFEYIYDREEMLEVLPWVIFHLESFDCAYVRRSIPDYLAGRLAREEGREVMLTGEGSDETFAGYSYLKDISSPGKLREEISKLISGLSHTRLQRVDRMNSAHGLECRVPFLKPSLLKFSLSLPLRWKLKQDGPGFLDKWILRRAFEDYLGADIAWRHKKQFDQGSTGVLKDVAEGEITEEEFRREAEGAPVPVRNREELYYYRIFRRYFPEEILPLVGRCSLME